MNTTQLMKALAGRWTLNRTLKSSMPPLPSGTFIGIANFTSRPSDGFDTELLYSENGELQTDSGLKMTGRRSYIYRLKDSLITCWFTTSEGAADYEFHDVALGDEKNGVLHATGTPHPCGQDHYETSYWFRLQEEKVVEWGVKYVVTGPKKDYVSNALFRRESVERL